MKFWDASAVVALLVDEPGSESWNKAHESDPVQVVWWATLVECESALQRRVRDGSLPMPEARTARARLQLLADAWSEVPASAPVRALAVRLLRTHPLRVADALQLAAALSLVQGGIADLAFLTADLRLAEAAEIEGLGLNS